MKSVPGASGTKNVSCPVPGSVKFCPSCHWVSYKVQNKPSIFPCGTEFEEQFVSKKSLCCAGHHKLRWSESSRSCADILESPPNLIRSNSSCSTFGCISVHRTRTYEQAQILSPRTQPRFSLHAYRASKPAYRTWYSIFLS